jgi:hypothetical protein
MAGRCWEWSGHRATSDEYEAQSRSKRRSSHSHPRVREARATPPNSLARDDANISPYPPRDQPVSMAATRPGQSAGRGGRGSRARSEARDRVGWAGDDADAQLLTAPLTGCESEPGSTV